MSVELRILPLFFRLSFLKSIVKQSNMSSKSSQSKFTQRRKKLLPFTSGRIIAQHESNRNAQEIDDFLGINWMHLIGCNIGPQMHRLMTTSHYDTDSPFANPLELTNSSIDDIVVNLTKSHLLVPTSFSGCLQNFAFKTGYNRTVDWIRFMKHTMPTIMLHHFEIDTQVALIAMSQICNIVRQREIDKVDLTVLKRCINKWSAWLASSVKDKKLAPWVFSIYQHLLTHLVRTIEYLGPMPSSVLSIWKRRMANLRKP